MEGKFLNLIKNTLQKPADNIIPSGEIVNAIHLKWEMRRRYPLSSLSFKMVQNVLPNAVRKGKNIQGVQSGKEEIKQCLFTDDMTVCVENPKELIKNENINKLLELTVIIAMLQDASLIYKSFSSIPEMNH